MLLFPFDIVFLKYLGALKILEFTWQSQLQSTSSAVWVVWSLDSSSLSNPSRISSRRLSNSLLKLDQDSLLRWLELGYFYVTKDV